MKVWTKFGDPQVNMNNVTIVQTYVRAYNHRKLSCQSELIKHCRHVPHPGLHDSMFDRSRTRFNDKNWQKSGARFFLRSFESF